MNRNGGGKLRLDQEAISEIVPEGSSVLDLYCGRGDLLAALVKERAVRG
jgi:ubiquinone/menaquinone biosynthesis C-methylase UbiE